MIIKKLYYGVHEISHVYLNGKVVWRGCVKPGALYDVYLTVDSETNEKLTTALVQEIMSGCVDWTVRENVNHNGTLIELTRGDGDRIVDTGSEAEQFVISVRLVNCYGDRIVTAETDTKDTHLTSISAGLGHADNTSEVELETSKCGDACDALVPMTDDSISIHVTRYATYFVAEIRNVDRDASYDVTTTHESTGMSAPAKLPYHSLDHQVYAAYSQNGIGADAVTADHSNDTTVNVEHKLDGADAVVGDGDHSLDTSVQETDVLYGVPGEIMQDVYSKMLSVESDDNNAYTPANVSVFFKDSNLSNDDDGYVYFHASDIAPAFKLSTLITTDDINGGAKNYGIIQLHHKRFDAAVDELEGHPIAMTAMLGDTSEIENVGYAENYAPCVELTKSISDITATPNENSETNAGCESVATGAHEQCKSIDILDLSKLYTGRIVSGGSEETIVCSTITEGYLNVDRGMTQPDYVYPVKTDTNLYIPQIYHAVKNGTNLSFNIITTN